MPTVLLRPFVHHQVEVIGIETAELRELELVIRKIKGVKWSQASRLWYLPLNRESYHLLVQALKGLATLDGEALKQHLQKRKRVAATTRASQPAPGIAFRKPDATTLSWQLTEANLAALKRFLEQLQLKAYSPSTLKTYRSEFLQLLVLLKNKAVDELTPDDLRRYFAYCLQKAKLTENTLHSRINAVKFYFEQVLKREKFFWDIPRPKKADGLPPVLSQQEVAAILNSIQNKKHKSMLMLAYSGGLRVSEVIGLKTEDVDSNRMTIFLRRAKGKKDRVVPLSPVLLVMLREYAKQYKPKRSGFLFEGQREGMPYSARSLQEVIQAAKRKAGVLRPGSIHLLRHSFATHLIEKGTDVTMIQKLLGHSNLQTTLRYLHTSNKDLLKIISPLDDLKLV